MPDRVSPSHLPRRWSSCRDEALGRPTSSKRVRHRRPAPALIRRRAKLIAVDWQDCITTKPPWLFQARMLGAATCQWLSVSCAATARSTSRAATSTALHKRLVPRPCIIDRVQHLRDRCCHLSPDWRGGAMRCAVHFRRIRLWLGDRCDATLRSGVAVEAGDAHRSDVRRDVDDLSSTRGDDCRYPEPAAKESANRSRRIARHSSIAASTTVLSAGSGSRRNCRLSLPHAGRPRGRLQRCRGAVSGASGEGSGEKRWR